MGLAAYFSFLTLPQIIIKGLDVFHLLDSFSLI